jgi:uncharacterized protein
MSGQGFLETVARQGQLVTDVGHRPWPLPDGPWAQAQTPRGVLLAHWPVPHDELARTVPPELSVDTFDGEAWLGLVAYRLTQLRLRGLPPIPGLSSLLQVEVRTYVTLDDRPGIWLCSLEVSNPFLVEAAKRAHRLPAFRARIRAEEFGRATRFEAERDDLAFEASYAPAGASFTAEPGTLDHFLCERFAVYTADGGRVYRAQLHHLPWQVAPAAGVVEATTLSPITLSGAPHLRLSSLQDELVWPLEEL